MDTMSFESRLWTKHLTPDEFHLIFKNKDQMEMVRLLDLLTTRMSTRLLAPTFRSMTVMRVTQSQLAIILLFTRKP